MSTSLSKREYACIESVHALSTGGWPARVKDVAARMNVTSPTAVEFLDKLLALKLVEKGPSGYRLSQEGIARFNDVTRAHRLFETLLASTGIPLEEACRISTSVGSIDVDTMETICAHLSHPSTCPHGRPIPVGDGHG